MPSTFTTNLGIEKPADGEQDGIWGEIVNENSDILDRAVNGVLSLSLSGTASTLTTSDGILSNGQYKLLLLTGTPSGTHTITIAPNDSQKIYYARNTTAQSVIFTQGSGGNYTLLAGDSAIIYSNGAGASAAVANITDHFAMSSPNITGGTITGITDLAIADGGTGASTAPDARTNLGLGTISTQASSAVAITGGSITGITDLAIADGGTGASTAAGALVNLGVTATAAEINVLDGITANVRQLNSSGEDVNSENRIINGDMGLWQRGTSGTINGYPVADRWVNSANLGTITQSRQSFAVGDTLGETCPTYFLRQSVVPTVGVTHFASTAQKIEGVRSYAGQTITVLGWARRFSGAGNMAVEGSQYFGFYGTPSPTVSGINPTTVTLSTSWEPFAVVLNVPSIVGKTIGSQGSFFDDSFNVNFWTSAGSNYNARTNSLGIQTIAVDLWGIHIRVGTWTAADAALYRPRDPGTELALCQRYYEVVSATAALNGSYINGYNFSVTKRTTPALAVVAGGLAGSTWQAEATRIVQINNSSGANGVTFGCDAEL